MEPPMLEPGREGLLRVRYDTQKRKEWGLLFEDIRFMTNDSANPEKSFTLSLSILEDPASLTEEQRQLAPVVSLDKGTHSFGSIMHGDTVLAVVTLRNSGKSPLVIRRIFSSCDCIRFDKVSEEIMPGNALKINVMMFTDELLGPQHKVLNIVTNDPFNQLIRFSFMGFVR